MVATQKRQYPGRLSCLSFFTRLEMAELPKLLMMNERVLGVISGFSGAGTVLLAVTSNRMLIIDKKWIRLSYEDIRYESINEVTYAQQAFLASAKFYIMGRELMFKSWYKDELRMLVQFVQDKMFETRPVSRADNSAAERDLTFAPQQTSQQQVAQVDQYLNERIARWRRASRFVDTIHARAETPKP